MKNVEKTLEERMMEACKSWIREFNAVSSSLLERAFRNDIDNLTELTTLTAGDYTDYNGESLRVNSIDFENEKAILELNDNVKVDLDDIETAYIGDEELHLVDVDSEDDVYSEDVEFNKITHVLYNDEKVEVKNFDCDEFELNTKLISVPLDELERPEFDGWLPMWSTLWSPDSSLDADWFEENAGKVSACGFRIFRDEVDGTIYLGIDGAGYNFWDAHWLPLYKERGLHWH